MLYFQVYSTGYSFEPLAEEQERLVSEVFVRILVLVAAVVGVKCPSLGWAVFVGQVLEE